MILDTDSLDEAAARAICRARLLREHQARNEFLPPGVRAFEAEIEAYWRDHLELAKAARIAIMNRVGAALGELPRQMSDVRGQISGEGDVDHG
jgi:hypothetical protein